MLQPWDKSGKENVENGIFKLFQFCRPNVFIGGSDLLITNIVCVCVCVRVCVVYFGRTNADISARSQHVIWDVDLLCSCPVRRVGLIDTTTPKQKHGNKHCESGRRGRSYWSSVIFIAAKPPKRFALTCCISIKMFYVRELRRALAGDTACPRSFWSKKNAM